MLLCPIFVWVFGMRLVLVHRVIDGCSLLPVYRCLYVIGWVWGGNKKAGWEKTGIVLSQEAHLSYARPEELNTHTHTHWEPVRHSHCAPFHIPILWQHVCSYMIKFKVYKKMNDTFSLKDLFLFVVCVLYSEKNIFFRWSMVCYAAVRVDQPVAPWLHLYRSSCYWFVLDYILCLTWHFVALY